MRTPGGAVSSRSSRPRVSEARDSAWPWFTGSWSTRCTDRHRERARVGDDGEAGLPGPVGGRSEMTLEPVARPTLRILIVDDDPCIEVVTRHARSDGHSSRLQAEAVKASRCFAPRSREGSPSRSSLRTWGCRTSTAGKWPPPSKKPRAPPGAHVDRLGAAVGEPGRGSPARRPAIEQTSAVRELREALS